MSEDRQLRRAEEHLFLCGVSDVAEQLCRANMTYGLAKIHHVERAMGLEPRALFVGAPDATVTRNSYRWRQGFGYGGQVVWNAELAVLDSKPNGCGMLVGVPHRRPDEAAVREAARAAREAQLTLDGVELAYDLAESNHFVDALELEQQLDPFEQLPEHLFIIHSSGHEHRPASPFGPGLYIDESEELLRIARQVETPWGPARVLAGAEARQYHDFCARVQDFNMQRRQLFGELLFGSHDVLCNATHQGMRAPGCFHLGAYWFEEEAQLFPLTLGPDQPVFLLRPRRNFSEQAIQKLGWEQRATRLGVMEHLTAANILPHGGGYSYPQLRQLLRVKKLGDRRIFVLEQEGGPPIEVEDPRALPFVYRDLAVLHRVTELQLAVPVARYRVRFVLKE